MRKWFTGCAAAVVMLSLGVPVVSLADDAEANAKIEAQFSRMDKDGNKQLSEAEFVGKRDGDAATRAKNRFKKLDADGNGTVSLDEFKAGMKPRKPKTSN